MKIAFTFRTRQLWLEEKEVLEEVGVGSGS